MSVIHPTCATSASCISEDRAWSPLSNSATRIIVPIRLDDDDDDDDDDDGVDDDGDDDDDDDDDAAVAAVFVVDDDAVAVAADVAVALKLTAKRFKASMSRG